MLVDLFLCSTFSKWKVKNCLETFHGSLEGFVLAVPMHKNCFNTCDSLQESSFGFSFIYLCFVTFLMFLYFLRTIQLLKIIFIDFLSVTKRVTLPNKIYSQHLRLWLKQLDGILGLIAGYAFLFFKHLYKIV